MTQISEPFKVDYNTKTITVNGNEDVCIADLWLFTLTDGELKFPEDFNFQEKTIVYDILRFGETPLMVKPNKKVVDFIEKNWKTKIKP